MASLRVFTEQNRQQILRSALNKSKSKSAWTFSKSKRFKDSKPYCLKPYYKTDVSTLVSRKPNIGAAQRNLFTQSSQAPSSWKYNPHYFEDLSTVTIAMGRNQVKYGCYIDPQKIKVPGPGQYKLSQQKSQKQQKGYTLRPQTAKSRNYFIENKELAERPAPGDYDTTDKVKMIGKNAISKFKSTSLGRFSRNKRFVTEPNTVPGSTKYMNNNQLKWSKGPKIGFAYRSTFIDRAQKQIETPGPGKYKLPTQFGHYLKFPIS